MEVVRVTKLSKSSTQTKALAALFAPNVRAGDVILLNGNLGAGKTQFTQGLTKELGIDEDVVSPTFTILHEYHSGILPVYHFDLYRLEHADQLEDIAYFEIIESDGISVVEWANKISESYPESYLEINIRILSEGEREIVFIAHGNRYHELLNDSLL